jgi:hypothetical protein
MAIAAHDCFGSVMRVSEGGVVNFLCVHCGRPFAVLDEQGLHITSRHGKDKDENTISLKVLKVMIGEIEKSQPK